MAASELLKELPSRDKSNFSKVSSSGAIKRCKMREYIKTSDRDGKTAQEIVMERDSFLVKALERASQQQQDQEQMPSLVVPVKRAVSSDAVVPVANKLHKPQDNNDSGDDATH